jgi:aryl-alcohol dehydrogenase-like predicted oxidoreductase
VRYRALGRTGLQVSEISLGSWLTLGGSIGESASSEIIRRALDLGVNLFDTANVYERGRAEEVVGRALSRVDRERFALATKVYFPMGPGREDRGLSRKHVFEQCDASLARLGIDVIDLYQCHRYDDETPLEETCRAMHDLAEQGKIRHWGVSEWTAEQIEDAIVLCERSGLQPPETDQPRYSLLQRGIESDVLPTCGRHGLGVLVFSALAQGVLTGKYRSPGEAPEGSRASHRRNAAWMRRLLTGPNLNRVNRLRPIAEGAGLTTGQLALAWVLRRHEVSSVIVGATVAGQLDENVAASGVELDPELIERIESAVRTRG